MSTLAEKMQVVPKTGIWRSVPFGTYRSWSAVNQSRLKCPTMAHYRCDHQPATSGAQMLGNLLHTGAFEPLAIAMRYVVMPQYDLDEENITAAGAPTRSKNTSYYKSKRAAFAEANRDKTIVPESDYNILLGVSESLAQSDRAQQYLGAAGDCEVSIVWCDEDTGILCKGRLDKWCRGTGHFVDLKSCRNAGQFPKSIVDYGYHVQAAFYQDGLATLTGERFTPILSAVEPHPPYACRTAPLGGDAIEAGRRQYKRSLQQIAKANESGVWPGYDDPECWSLPEWYAEPIFVHGEKVIA